VHHTARTRTCVVVSVGVVLIICGHILGRTWTALVGIIHVTACFRLL
jgi:hypothetical protein